MEWLSYLDAIVALLLGWFLKAWRIKADTRQIYAQAGKLEHETFSEHFQLLISNMREQLESEIRRRNLLEEQITHMEESLKRLKEENNTLRGTLEQLQASYNQLLVDHQKWLKDNR